ncbi:YchJ family protein [Microbacterium sp. NPDC089695]|uniref:YchJ family protein n=1 Tax=Microbacterium sp. NPDC089695 TaxID=3364198 RepID=UPI003825652C
MTGAVGMAPDDRTGQDALRCPCGSGDVFAGCCGPVLDGAPAPTAERLMRSRYTAFSLGNIEHLLASWHPTTRPASLDLDADMRWRRLVIVDRVAGGPFDRDGVVEFAAAWEQNGERGVLRERSRFVREDRRWLYVDGDVA